MKYVSAHPNTKNNIILKVGKDRGFYLVDVHGQFFNRPKLESMITFRTDFVSIQLETLVLTVYLISVLLLDGTRKDDDCQR